MDKIFLLVLCTYLVCTSVVWAHGHLQDQEQDSSVPDRVLHDFDVVSGPSIRVLHLSNKRSMTTRHQMRQPFPDDLSIELEGFGVTFHLDLTINEHLLHPQSTRQIMNGRSVVREEKMDHRYYRGTASSKLGTGWARITVHETGINEAVITGAFVQDGDIYYLKTPEHFSRMTAKPSSRARHSHKRALESDVNVVMYRSSDIQVNNPHAYACGVDDAMIRNFNNDPPGSTQVVDGHDVFSGTANYSQIADSFGKRAGSCYASTQVAYTGVVADGNYVAYYGGVTAAENQALTDWNLVNSVYEKTFNVMLGVLTFQAQQASSSTPQWNQPCTNGPTITERLSYFSEWRGTQSPTAGLYHLLTTCSTPPVIGIAWLNMLCTTSSYAQNSNGQTQYVSGTAISTVIDEEWLVIAHETGHNFGSIHDCMASTCPAVPGNCYPCTPNCDCQGQYIMNPVAGTGGSTFSPTSTTQMCIRSQSTGTCFGVPGSQPVLNKGICGNGIKEQGEQCDCGGTVGCKGNPCCFPNCTLTPGSACNNDTNTLCCRNCQVNPAPILCRPASNPICDIPEYCNGVSPDCPPDNFTADGTPCVSNSSMFTDTVCATGVCTSRSMQCYQRAIATGSSDTYTQDCPQLSGSCEIFCSSALNSCTFFYGTFRNGTPCGTGGYCYGGQCSKPDLVGTILEFIQQNVIMVAIGGAMVGIMLLGFLVWGCQQAGRKKIDPTRPGTMTRLRTMGRNLSHTIRHGRQKGKGKSQNIAMNPSSPSPPPFSAPAPVYYSPSTRPDDAQFDYNDRSNQLRAIDAQQKQQQRRSMNATPPAQGPHNYLVTDQPPTYDYTANSSAAGPSLRLSSAAQPVRCPICQQFFPSEVTLNTHLDLDHA